MGNPTPAYVHMFFVLYPLGRPRPYPGSTMRESTDPFLPPPENKLILFFVGLFSSQHVRTVHGYNPTVGEFECEQ
jgi:hypothetical protein